MEEQVMINVIETEEGVKIVKSRLIEEVIEEKPLENIDEAYNNIIGQLNKVEELELAKTAIEVYRLSKEDFEEVPEVEDIEEDQELDE